MSKVAGYRRENIRALIDQRGGQTRLSKAMGWKNSSFLAQMAGPNPTREVTEKTARKIEEVMRLEPSALDRPPGGVSPAPAPRPAPVSAVPGTGERRAPVARRRGDPHGGQGLRG